MYMKSSQTHYLSYMGCGTFPTAPDSPALKLYLSYAPKDSWFSLTSPKPQSCFLLRPLLMLCGFLEMKASLMTLFPLSQERKIFSLNQLQTLTGLHRNSANGNTFTKNLGVQYSIVISHSFQVFFFVWKVSVVVCFGRSVFSFVLFSLLLYWIPCFAVCCTLHDPECLLFSSVFWGWFFLNHHLLPF